MLQRRHIAVLIAGLLVGAQIVGAVSSESSPSSAGEGYAEPTPIQAESTEAVAEPVSGTAVAEETGYVIPFTGGLRVSVAPSDTFPSSADDEKMLPALAEYLDRRAATTMLTGAPGPVFPTSGEEWIMLPAMIAHFDQREATRMAARDQMVARSDIAGPESGIEQASLLPPQTPSSGQEAAASEAATGNGSSLDSGN